MNNDEKETGKENTQSGNEQPPSRKGEHAVETPEPPQVMDPSEQPKKNAPATGEGDRKKRVRRDQRVKE